MIRSRCRERNSKKNIEDSQIYSDTELPLSEQPKLKGRKRSHVESLCGEGLGLLVGVRRADRLELRHEPHLACWCQPELVQEGDWVLVVHRAPGEADA